MALPIEDGLRALREATDLARSLKVELTEEYLRLVAAVEALPENQPGADKSGRWRGNHAYWCFIREGRIVARRP